MNRPAASPRAAIGFALAGFSCWVVSDSLMKLASEMSTAKYQIMGAAGISGLLFIFALTALRGETRRLRPRNYRALAGLGFLFLMNYAVWLTALVRLPLANFYTVLFLAPTASALFAVVFLKESLTLKKLLAIVAGFIGVVVAVNPAHLLSGKSDWIGYGIAFIGMLVVVAQILTLRAVGNHESREAMAFYPRIAVVAAALVAAAIWGVQPMPLREFGFSIATGAVGSIGWMLMAQAYKLAPAATVAPFQYSQILTSALLGYLIWRDVPSPHLLAGAAIIIASGLYILSHTRAAAAPLVKTPVATP